MLYLFFDLVVFDGPLKMRVYKMQGHPAAKAVNDIEQGIVARVFGKAIYLSQVDYAVEQKLWRSGRCPSEISPATLEAMREHALRELCDFAILREKVALNRDQYPISTEETEAAYQRFVSRFSTTKEFTQALEKMHFKGSKEVKMRLEARLQQNKYLEHHIARGIAASDDEAKAWYHDHQKQLTRPELRKTRHIFLSEQSHDEAKALALLEPALTAILADSRQFPTYSDRLNNDPKAKQSRGTLGFLSHDRCPPSIADAIFSLPLNNPRVIESKIGWHLIEVREILPPSTPGFEQVKPQILNTLENSRRKSAVSQYRQNLRLQHAEKIIVHDKLLQAPWSE